MPEPTRPTFMAITSTGGYIGRWFWNNSGIHPDFPRWGSVHFIPNPVLVHDLFGVWAFLFRRLESKNNAGKFYTLTAMSDIKFLDNDNEVIRIDGKGFHYRGEFIEDAGEAHRLLIEFLRKHQPEGLWKHAE